MSDLIKRSDAIEVAYQLRRKPNDAEWDWWLKAFNAIPRANNSSVEEMQAEIERQRNMIEAQRMLIHLYEKDRKE